MDHQALADIANRAILYVLNFHLTMVENRPELTDLDQPTKDSISDGIHWLLPLEVLAADKRAVHLEIICDVAVDVAEKYGINKSWFYGSVQVIASNKLLPSLHANFEDPVRLHRGLLGDEGEAEGEAESEGDDEEEDEAPQPPTLATNENIDIHPVEGSHEHWDDNETLLLIDLKVAGASSLVVSEVIHRSVASIDNKWQTVSNELNWSDYIQQKRTAKTNYNESKGQMMGPWTEPEIREMIDLKVAGVSAPIISRVMHRSAGSINDKWSRMWYKASGEYDLMWKDIIQQKFNEKRDNKDVPSHARTAKTFTTPPAPIATDTPHSRAMPWTEPQIRDLIDLKTDGVDWADIAKQMNRSWGSVAGTYHNLKSKPRSKHNSKWKDYIQERLRAKEAEKEHDQQANADVERQAKGLQGGKRSKSAMTVGPGSVSYN